MSLRYIFHFLFVESLTKKHLLTYQNTHLGARNPNGVDLSNTHLKHVLIPTTTLG